MSIYLDYNATAPLLPEVERSLKKNLRYFGNPSSLHHEGREAWQRIDRARQTISRSLNVDAENLTFTSGGTESNNNVLKGIFIPKIADKHPTHLLISAIEHPSLSRPAHWLTKLGVELDILPVDHLGQIKINQLESLIKPHTHLISIMTANNETGTCQPLESVTKIAKKYGIPVHTDAVQAWGKIPLNFATLDVDYVSLSGHKIGAPKGIGILIAKNPKSLVPLLQGGAQEYKRRAGTENSLGILGLEAAIQTLSPDPLNNNLRQYFLSQIQSNLPNVLLNGHPEQTLPNTLNLSFIGASAEGIMMNLDLEKIAVSTGSACSSGSTEVSSVLTAMGLSTDCTSSAVRFSFGPHTTINELDQTIAALIPIVERIRNK